MHDIRTTNLSPGTPAKILVIRNDKLGDFILSLPAFTLLKQNLPGTEIIALLPGYTEPLAALSPAIDRIILDPGPHATYTLQYQLYRQLQQENFAAAISLYSSGRVGFLLRLCRIPVRIAPATKLAQLLHNHRVVQRRSRSEKPEHQYNTELALYYLQTVLGLAQIQPVYPPYLQFPALAISTLRSELCHRLKLDSKLPLIFLHPGSGGSASNLSLDQYARLAIGLHQHGKLSLVITAGPGELDYANNLADRISLGNCRVYHSDQGLVAFCQHIQCADLFIAGSTGTLHIAGALDVATVGFYPRRRSATPLRWQTLNSAAKRLAFCPPEGADPEDMASIDIDAVINSVYTHYPRLLRG